jgi:DNA-directed RNA polymerase specialized sigma subunit
MPTRDKPIDQFIKDASTFTADQEAKYRELRGRRGPEAELWNKWNQSGRRPEHLEPLLKSLQPMIRSEATKRMTGLGGSIPKSALEAQLMTATVKQLESYDPDKSALSSHVTQGFRRTTDYVAGNRNAKYMPPADVKRYQVFENAHNELEEQLGRAPTPQELKTVLPWKINDIKKMQKGFGKEIYTDMGDGVSSSENHATLSPRDSFHMVKSQLTEEERRFGEHYFPPPGAPTPAIANIAKTLGISPGRAYKLKANVERRAGVVRNRG